MTRGSAQGTDRDGSDRCHPHPCGRPLVEQIAERGATLGSRRTTLGK